MSGTLRLLDPRSWGVPFKLALFAGLGLVFLDDVGALGDVRRARAPALCLLGGLLVAMDAQVWNRARAEQWVRSFGTPLLLGGILRSVVMLTVLWVVLQLGGDDARGLPDLAFGLTGAALTWNEVGRRALPRGADDPQVGLGHALVPALVAALIAVFWTGTSGALVIVVGLAAAACAARRLHLQGSAALSP